jgi:hypothetical protein
MVILNRGFAEQVVKDYGIWRVLKASVGRSKSIVIGGGIGLILEIVVMLVLEEGNLRGVVGVT